MLILKSYTSIWASAKWGKFIKGFNSFPLQYDKAPEVVDLINFSVLGELNPHFVKTEILPIRRRAAFENNLLTVMLRGAKAIRSIESESGRILVSLQMPHNDTRNGNPLPNIRFIVCDSVSIGFKSSEYGSLFAYDDTVIVFRNFSVVEMTSYKLTDELCGISDGNEKMFTVKGKDLSVECFDVDGRFFIHRIEAYSEAVLPDKEDEVIRMPAVTSVTITDENTLRLHDDSPGSKMKWGVRLVHEMITTSYSWEKAFPNLLEAYVHLKSMDLAQHYSMGKWLNVPLKGGKIDELNEYETIDNR